MTTHFPRCFLLGQRTLRPFCGHFELQVVQNEIAFHLSGRIGSTLHPEEALGVLSQVQGALRKAEGSDCLSVIRSCWENLWVIPRKELGAEQGRDLSLLILAQSSTECALSAVGLDALWGVSGHHVQQIAGPTTPETTHPGLPERAPKALELPLSDRRFIGSCLGDGSQFPGVDSLLVAEAGPQ